MSIPPTADDMNEVLRAGDGELEIVIVFADDMRPLLRAAAADEPLARATLTSLKEIVEMNLAGGQRCLLCTTPTVVLDTHGQRNGLPGFFKAVTRGPADLWPGTRAVRVTHPDVGDRLN